MPQVQTLKLLAQRQLTSTADTVLYRPPNAATTTLVKTMIVCNTTGSATTYSVWVNGGNTTTGDAFALIKNIPLAATASDQRIYPGDAGIVLTGSDAAILAKSGTSNAITITLFGVEIEET